MKKLSPTLVRIASITGLALGAFTISALAADWTAAPCTAPSCNVSAPINVGPDDQSKEGGLAVGKTTGVSSYYKLDVYGLGLFQGLFVSGETETKTLVVNGVSAGDHSVGNVLTSDGTGFARWAPGSGALKVLSGFATSECHISNTGTGQDGVTVCQDNVANLQSFGYASVNYVYKDVTFSTPFTVIPQVLVTPRNFGSGTIASDPSGVTTATDHIGAWPINITTTGFRMICFGSPTNVDYTEPGTCSWLAIGQ